MFRRSLQLGLIVKDMAWLRFRPSERARRRLIDRLSLSHGLPQKIGQILATTELSSSDQSFTQLTEDKPTLSPKAALQEIQLQIARLHPSPTCTPRSIDPQGISASIGQVHRATLQDGRIVAIKIQHPGISSAIETDLRALGWLTVPVGNLRRGFDQAAYRREIGEKLAHEIDYRHEAENLRRFTADTAALPGLLLPKLVPELSSPAIITQTWLHGERFSATSSFSAAARRQIATTLLRLFFSTTFQTGFLHADPHPGNYRFTAKGEVGLLDFGCLHEIPVAISRTWLELIQMSRAHLLTTERVWNCFQRLGFDPTLLSPLRAQLPAITRCLLAPFEEDRPFDLSLWSMGPKLTALLGEHRMAFRLAGPAHHLYLIRGFQGLLRYLKALGTPLNWCRLLDETLAPETFAPLSSSLTAEPIITSPSDHQRPGRLLSKNLCLLVTENGNPRVKLTFASEALANLPDFIPDDIKPRLAARQIDPARLTADALARSAPRGELFFLNDGAKHFRVWLE